MTDVSSKIVFCNMNNMHEAANQKMNFEFDSFLPFIRHNPNIAAAEATYINFDPECVSNGFPLSEIAKNITMYSNIEILPMLSIDLDILLFFKSLIQYCYLLLIMVLYVDFRLSIILSGLCLSCVIVLSVLMYLPSLISLCNAKIFAANECGTTGDAIYFSL